MGNILLDPVIPNPIRKFKDWSDEQTFSSDQQIEEQEQHLWFIKQRDAKSGKFNQICQYVLSKTDRGRKRRSERERQRNSEVGRKRDIMGYIFECMYRKKYHRASNSCVINEINLYRKIIMSNVYKIEVNSFMNL